MTDWKLPITVEKERQRYPLRMRGSKGVMKRQKQRSVNLERLRAANSLNKSNQQLRSRLIQSTSGANANRNKIGFVLGGLVLSLLVFGWLQCGNRETSAPYGDRQFIQSIEQNLV